MIGGCLRPEAEYVACYVVLPLAMGVQDERPVSGFVSQPGVGISDAERNKIWATEAVIIWNDSAQGVGKHIEQGGNAPGREDNVERAVVGRWARQSFIEDIGVVPPRSLCFDIPFRRVRTAVGHYGSGERGIVGVMGVHYQNHRTWIHTERRWVLALGSFLRDPWGKQRERKP